MDIKNRLNFFYSKLTDEEKRIYIEIVNALYKLNKFVKIKLTIFQVDFQSIILAVKEDYPEFFYVDFSKITISTNNYSSIIYFVFYYNDIDIYWLTNKLTKIVETIYITGNNAQDEFNIHKFIVNNISYSDFPISNDAHTIKGAIIDKKAVCEGYSKTFKFLCNYANIPCIIVSGLALNNNGLHEKHSWNIVKINNNYFHVDSTWNRNTLENIGISLYLNISDNFISGNHVWERGIYPRCSTKSNLESQIINIDNISYLHTILNDVILKRQRHLLLSFNFKITGTDDFMTLIKKTISKINITSSISYKSTYITELNCGVVLFDY